MTLGQFKAQPPTFVGRIHNLLASYIFIYCHCYEKRLYKCFCTKTLDLVNSSLPISMNDTF